MQRTRARRLPVFSLRELLLLVAFFAVGCAALTFANEIWWMALATITGLACLVAAVVAVIDRGPRQAFAIGFIICAGLYFGLVAFPGRPTGYGPGNSELNTTGVNYPTSRLLLFEQVVETTWIDPATGQVIPNYQPPNQPPNQPPATPGFSPGGAYSPPGSVFGRLQPNPETFMRIGHALWILLFGYVGGRFGRFVYKRRINDATPSEEAAPTPGSTTS